MTETKKKVLIPTTFGSRIIPPFDGAILEKDGPDDDKFDIRYLSLVPIPESITTMEEVVQIGQINPKWN